MCILLSLFLSLCRFCLFVFCFICSHWSFVDVPLIFFCPADHVPDWQPRILLGMVEARSVNLKKTTTTTTIRYVVCWTEKDQKNIYKAPTRAKKHNGTKQKRRREMNNNKIHMPEKDRRRALDRESLVLYSASREPSDTHPGSQPCTQTCSIYHTPYSQGCSFL